MEHMRHVGQLLNILTRARIQTILFEQEFVEIL